MNTTKPIAGQYYSLAVHGEPPEGVEVLWCRDADPDDLLSRRSTFDTHWMLAPVPAEEPEVDDDPLEYANSTYGTSWAVGDRVQYGVETGVVIGGSNYVHVRMDDGGRRCNIHPTDEALSLLTAADPPVPAPEPAEEEEFGATMGSEGQKEAPKVEVIDLMEALKKSLEESQKEEEPSDDA